MAKTFHLTGNQIDKSIDFHWKFIQVNYKFVEINIQIK
jgi:hypothetical protein